MNSGSMPLLCPFFEKCDGILLINSADGSEEFHPCDQSGAKSACEVIINIQRFWFETYERAHSLIPVKDYSGSF